MRERDMSKRRQI